MKILAIIVSYNFEYWLDRCLSSLIDSEYPIDILVIDNASKDQTVQRIKNDYPKVRLIESQSNLGFGRANNIGMQLAIKENYDAIFLVNQDAWIETDTVGTLMRLCTEYAEYGIFSPTHLTGSGNKLDPGFSTYSRLANISQLPQEENILCIPFVNAAFWMIPVSVLKKIGGFCPLFYHYGEDKDFVNRLLYHGYKIGYSPNAFAYHDREYRPTNYERFLRSEYVYHLSEYANIRYSFGKAFAYGVLATFKKCTKNLFKGNGKQSMAFLKMGIKLLIQSYDIYNYRKINKLSQPNYIQPV